MVSYETLVQGSTWMGHNLGAHVEAGICFDINAAKYCQIVSNIASSCGCIVSDVGVCQWYSHHQWEQKGC